MKQSLRARQIGAISAPIVIIVILAVAVLGLAGFGAWSYVNYQDQKTNVDSKISRAVALAEKEQKATDEKEFLEREKQPNRTFRGPADLGSLSFMYPKTWSLYIESEASDGGDYQAYFNPVSVPPVDADEQRFALRVVIRTTQMDEVLSEYQSLVEEGGVSSSAMKVNGVNASRFNGTLTEEIKGSAVIFRIRDKVVTLQTDANTFTKDFDALLKTVKFDA